jgi:hypothetical protein
MATVCTTINIFAKLKGLMRILSVNKVKLMPLRRLDLQQRQYK